MTNYNKFLRFVFIQFMAISLAYFYFSIGLFISSKPTNYLFNTYGLFIQTNITLIMFLLIFIYPIFLLMTIYTFYFEGKLKNKIFSTIYKFNYNTRKTLRILLITIITTLFILGTTLTALAVPYQRGRIDLLLITVGPLILSPIIFDCIDEYDKANRNFELFITSKEDSYIIKALKSINKIFGEKINQDSIYKISNLLAADMQFESKKYENQLIELSKSIITRNKEKISKELFILLKKMDIPQKEIISIPKYPMRYTLLKGIKNNFNIIIPSVVTLIYTTIILLLQYFGIQIPNT